MSDHKADLPFLPREADQGGAQDVHSQKRQQDHKARAFVDPFLHRRCAVPRLEESCITQGHRQSEQRNHRELQRRQEPVDCIDDPRKSIQRWRRSAGFSRSAADWETPVEPSWSLSPSFRTYAGRDDLSGGTEGGNIHREHLHQSLPYSIRHRPAGPDASQSVRAL